MICDGKTKKEMIRLQDLDDLIFKNLEEAIKFKTFKNIKTEMHKDFILYIFESNDCSLIN